MSTMIIANKLPKNYLEACAESNSRVTYKENELQVGNARIGSTNWCQITDNQFYTKTKSMGR